MKNFDLDEDCLYCKTCEERGLFHQVSIIVNTESLFELECGVLRKPRTVEVDYEKPILLKCDTCGKTEEITTDDLNGAKWE